MKASIREALAWCCLLLLALPIGTQGAAGGSAPEDAAGRSTQPVVAPGRMGAPDVAPLVDVGSLRLRLKKGPPVVLVDVRSPEAFDRVRIPGSLNIPLHCVRTKSFLKSASLVLVNEGFPARSLAEACAGLKSDGFTAAILSGGLDGWHQAGGPLEGDLAAAGEFSRVSAQTFLGEKSFGSWVVVDVAPLRSDVSRALLPHALHVPFEGNPAAAADRVKAAVAPRIQGPLTAALIVDESGLHYDGLEKALRLAGLERVFFLTGGIEACRRYLEDLARLWLPRESRIKTITPCPTCGESDRGGS